MHLHQALLAVVVYVFTCSRANALSTAAENAKDTMWALPAVPLPVHSNIAGHDGVRSLRVEDENSEQRNNVWIPAEQVDQGKIYHVPSLEGLEAITDPKDLFKIMNTDNFRVYTRYVNKFDTYVLSSLEAGYSPPHMMVSYGASKAEMVARTAIMAEAGRPAAYAKLAL
ncbi:unnamed protein product [Phytophthora fragariaefolia]|uniref:Unnamed protein product n=1 Tax=Phytophthora fragariaefolia TaxID=1490495 RepID=A0A9W6TY33_9STRA|nr:unnamed protein product [Phytophthora fragariaefolia]